ncbi:single stranded DNA binding protein 3b [Silurus meridionalis]|nr:single stranded DNA binding protein 3b [Silurus meridionalis]
MPYSSPSPGAYGGPQGGGPPGTPGIVPSPADSNNSSENLYTMMNSGGGGRTSFPIGPGSEGPLGAMAGMDPMHMNGVTSHLMKIVDFKEVDATLANILNHLETYQCQLDTATCVEFDIGLPGVFKGSGMEKLMLDL